MKFWRPAYLLLVLIPLCFLLSSTDLSIRRSFASAVPSGLLQRSHNGIEYWLYVPPGLEPGSSHRVLVLSHGFGNEPGGLMRGFQATADARGWILLGPHFLHGDYMKPEVVRREDWNNSQWLASLLGELGQNLPLRLEDRVLMYGLSRGAQFAQRFALLFPRKVLAVAAMAGGSYTVPLPTWPPPQGYPLEFPMGLGNLQKDYGRSYEPDRLRDIYFWIGIGDRDNVRSEVAREWDIYLGSNRLERARKLAEYFTAMGVATELTIFQGMGHGEHAESRQSAIRFLEKAETLLPPWVPQIPSN